MRKIINFIKYNNAFTIIFALVLFSTGATFANEKVRDTVVGQTIITKKGIDNTQIISANLDNFNMGLRIKSVKEDGEFYYVSFDYNAIDAKDNVWQIVKKEKNVNVLKTRLGDMDLGLYLAEELKQLTDREFAYMKEVQSIEKNKGAQKQTESTEYTGLKGLVFNNETKEIIGYEPVKEEEKEKTITIDATALTIKAVDNKEENKKTENEKVVQQITVVKEVISKESIMQMVREAMDQEKVIASSSSSLSTSTATTSSSSSSSLSNSSVSGGSSGNQTSDSSSSATTESSSSSASVSSSESSSSTASSSEANSSSSSEEAVSSSSSSISSSEANSSQSSESSLPAQAGSSSESSSSSAEAPASSSSVSSESSSQPSLGATAGQASL